MQNVLGDFGRCRARLHGHASWQPKRLRPSTANGHVDVAPLVGARSGEYARTSCSNLGAKETQHWV